ncbi:hypothetical protein PHYSODRAFT_457316, partial [Phytophthora sojae]
LAREHGRARLRAFAAVPLELHVGLDDDEVLSRRSLLRVCEWASLSGSWELRDHYNAAVGRVTGAVTLSCLGKTLAPHLTQALGVQVSKPQPSSPRVGAQEKEQTQLAKTKSSGAEGQLLYYKNSAKGATSPRRIRSRPRRDSSSRPMAAAKGELLFPRELPPPLFFQK